jgi:hypothetical protein
VVLQIHVVHDVRDAAQGRFGVARGEGKARGGIDEAADQPR